MFKGIPSKATSKICNLSRLILLISKQSSLALIIKFQRLERPWIIMPSRYPAACGSTCSDASHFLKSCYDGLCLRNGLAITSSEFVRIQDLVPQDCFKVSRVKLTMCNKVFVLEVTRPKRPTECQLHGKCKFHKL